MAGQPLRPMNDERQPAGPVDAAVRIGHVHLKVADLERALAFYCGILGFELMARSGDRAAFVAAGGYHHHIGLNTWESLGGSPPPAGATGLYPVPFTWVLLRSCWTPSGMPDRWRLERG